jgi:hypothetical protein
MLTALLPLRLYWTRQHGAYITLISSWIIAVSLFGFTWLQLPAIVFLLASINGVELFTEQLKRKSPMPLYKITSKYFYSTLGIFCGLILLLFSQTFRQLIPVLAIFPPVFIYLAKKRKQKSLLSEFFTFLFFVITSFIGCKIELWTSVIIAMLIMTLFFSSSIFTVKQRLGRLDRLDVLLYMIASILIILTVTQLSTFGIFTTVLIFIKTAGAWGFPDWYRQLKIKQIGMLETVMQIAFVLGFMLIY